MNDVLFTVSRDVTMPCRAHSTDSGIDFYIPNDLKSYQVTPSEGNGIREVEDGKITIFPWEWVLIPSWIKMIIPDGYDMVFENKSWVASKLNLVVWAKVVDSSYRGEVHIHLINTSCTFPVRLALWAKIIQWIIRKVENPQMNFIANDVFEENTTERGTGWFGSTGS